MPVISTTKPKPAPKPAAEQPAAATAAPATPAAGGGSKTSVAADPVAQPVAEPVAAAAPVADVIIAAPEADSAQIRSIENADDVEPGEGEIVFMCPEGHHLCGPSSLVDHPGECPICHVKFIVPSPDSLEDHDPEIHLEQLLAAASAPEGYAFDSDDSSPRGLGALFLQLWKYRAQGCAVELHLGEGRVLVPSGFAVESAGLTHGLFTIGEPNGAVTMSVVRWDTIERINVRGLFHLPRGVTFDLA